MISLPIPDKLSPVRYHDLSWRGRNLGEMVAKLTRGKQRADYNAHLDPDLRKDMCRRERGWRPTLGQLGSAQGHLRNQGVRVGDLFLFWGLFRAVDHELRWLRRRENRIWGWLQVGAVAPVDDVVRGGGEKWRWAEAHPHLAFPPDQTNTLYVASERLSLPGVELAATPGSGVFEFVEGSRRLTAKDATKPSEWSLPPRGRPALTYHHSPERWSEDRDSVRLRVVSKGQEFVLDLALYPELTEWLMEVIVGGRQ